MFARIFTNARVGPPHRARYGRAATETHVPQRALSGFSKRLQRARYRCRPRQRERSKSHLAYSRAKRKGSPTGATTRRIARIPELSSPQRCSSLEPRVCVLCHPLRQHPCHRMRFLCNFGAGLPEPCHLISFRRKGHHRFQDRAFDRSATPPRQQNMGLLVTSDVPPWFDAMSDANSNTRANPRLSSCDVPLAASHP